MSRRDGPVIGPNATLKFRPEFHAGLVVSACPVASSVGMQVLRLGGTATDAAVAVGATLAVTYPQAGNLAGGGFALGTDAHGEPWFLDYRETAPGGVREELYVDRRGRPTESCRFGGKSVGVPGTVAGLAALLERHGTWGWDRVLASAIEVAEHGVWQTSRQAAFYELYETELRRFPSTQRAFLPGGAAPLPGTRFAPHGLGRTLRLLADRGPEAFYQGEIADAIVRAAQSDGGVLTHEDLAGYRPHWRTPLRNAYEGWDIITAPPPSCGGFVVLLALALLERNGVRDLPAQSPERLALVARALRAASYARRELIADPDHDPYDDPDELCRYIREHGNASGALESFDEASLRAPKHKAPKTSGSTTHYCVIDREERIVSNTYSLNTLFGSKLCVDGYGMLLNNTIDDFQVVQGMANWYGVIESDRNALRPGRRPVGSMAPTLFRREGEVEVAAGGAGGPRIASLITQLAVSLLSDGTSLEEALQRPRIHHQCWPDYLYVEERLPPETLAALESAGFSLFPVTALGMGAALKRDRKQKKTSALLDQRFFGPWGGGD